MRWIREEVLDLLHHPRWPLWILGSFVAQVAVYHLVDGWTEVPLAILAAMLVGLVWELVDP